MLDGVRCQQLQNADVVVCSVTHAESLDERPTKLSEHTRQLPVAVHRSVIESGRFAFQSRQEMKRIEDLLPTPVTANVSGDCGSVTDHFNAVDVPLHAHGSERPPTRHAVTVAVEANGLVLVHLAWLDHTRIELADR